MTTIFVSGPSNSGKTTLIERLIPILIGRGLRVAAAKHDPHGHAMVDAARKDSWRFAQAGAAVVDILGPGRRLSLSRSGADDELSSEAEACDMVLVEGFKKGPYPRVEVLPLGSKPALEPGTFALVADHDVASDLPAFRHEDAEALADFLLEKLTAFSPPVVILSGGDSRRMGRDKATIALRNGQTMLGRAIVNARAATGRVAVISRHSKHETVAVTLAAAFVRDEGPQHPANGLVAALQTFVGDSGVIAIPCDSPEVSPAILRRLASTARQNTEFACFAVSGRLNPLPGYFALATVQQLKTIAAEGLPLHSLATQVRTSIISEREARNLDPGLRSFRSINRPEDLHRLELADLSAPGDPQPDEC